MKLRRAKIMRKSVLQACLLSTVVLFLTTWAGAQSNAGVSNQTAPASSTNAASSSVDQTEKQEMREELRALRAEVERLRAEVEQQHAVPAGARQADSGQDRSELAPSGAGPSVPSVTAANFAVPPSVTTPGQPAAAAAAQSEPATPPAKAEPFAFADWTWLN